MSTFLTVIFVLIGIVIFLAFVWYYIKQFGSIAFGNGCTGCALTIALVLGAIGFIVYFLFS